MIAWLRVTYRKHGTKIYGALQTLLATGVALVAVVAADPQTQIIIPPRWFAYLSVGNAMLGVLTLKRGFTNTRNLSP